MSLMNGSSIQHNDERKFDPSNWKKYIEGWYKEYTLPGRKMHEKRITNGITQYNAAHMGVGRASLISSHFKQKIIGIQSTCRESDEDVFTETTKNHITVHFPA